jgi:hypothetical protein
MEILHQHHTAPFSHRTIGFAISAVLCCHLLTYAQFVHPGILSSQGELDFIKATVNGTAAHPMKTGYTTMKSFYGANLSYTPNPLAQVAVVASGVGPDEANFRDAAQAGYAHALQWVITGNSANKDKAIQIFNAWSKVFKGMTPTDAQRQLEAAWVIPTWIAGAEIIRYYNRGAAGWAAADIAGFCGMMDTLYSYTKLIYVDKRTNNWGSSAALSMLAVGVFENDTAKFNAGKTFYEFLLPYQVEKTGLVMETCRDCNHAEYNMIGMLQAAEVAWHQGVDLYGLKLDAQAAPRLMMGMEFQANSFLGTPLNVGQSCGAVSCSGDDLHGPGWEIGRNHYLLRLKLPIPATDKFVLTKNRPVGTSENHFVEWSTLTHADLGLIPSTSGVIAKSRISPSATAATPVFMHQQGSLGPYPWERQEAGSRVEILNLQGKRVAVFQTGSGGQRAMSPMLATGTYLLRLEPTPTGADAKAYR